MNLTANRPATMAGDIWVATNGRRWVREDHPSNDHKEKALTTLPDLTFFTVFDQAMLDATPPMGKAWLAEIEARDRDGLNLKIADSIDGLAREMGVDPATFADTIAAWNAAVSAGRDAEFGREHLKHRIEHGPFYAVRCKAFILSTRGGIRIDDELRVLRTDGSPIDGLYAIGEVTGFGRLSGDAQVGGMGVGPCFSLGRWAGRMLAQRLGGSAVTA
jgi:succinate dehydrogenase/fumarate reductase flavoprotein subunit